MEKSKKFWTLFILVIILLRIIPYAILKIYPGWPPNLLVDIFYSISHIAVVVSFLCYFKYQSIIISSFKPENKREIYIVIVLIALVFIIFTIFGKPMSIQIFLNKFTINQIFVVSSEELFFRVFIIGVLLGNISIFKLPFSDNLKVNLLKVIISLIVSSLLFAFWHPTDFENHFKTGILFGLFFILSNKKIYPSWLFHYYT